LGKSWWKKKREKFGKPAAGVRAEKKRGTGGKGKRVTRGRSRTSMDVARIRKPWEKNGGDELERVKLSGINTAEKGSSGNEPKRGQRV